MKIQAIDKFVPKVYKQDMKMIEDLTEYIAEKEYKELGNPRITPEFMVDFQHLIAEKMKLIVNYGLVDKIKPLDVLA